jgi:hypothetical protein
VPPGSSTQPSAPTTPVSAASIVKPELPATDALKNREARKGTQPSAEALTAVEKAKTDGLISAETHSRLTTKLKSEITDWNKSDCWISAKEAGWVIAISEKLKADKVPDYQVRVEKALKEGGVAKLVQQYQSGELMKKEPAVPPTPESKPQPQAVTPPPSSQSQQVSAPTSAAPGGPNTLSPQDQKVVYAATSHLNSSQLSNVFIGATGNQQAPYVALARSKSGELRVAVFDNEGAIKNILPVTSPTVQPAPQTGAPRISGKIGGTVPVVMEFGKDGYLTVTSNNPLIPKRIRILAGNPDSLDPGSFK